MSAQEQIKQVEDTIEEARKQVDLARRIRKLERNPDFKKVILDGYFVDEASRLVLLNNDPSVPEAYRETIRRDMDGFSALKRYLMSNTQLGDSAERAIGEHEDTLEELRIESVGGSFDDEGDDE
jgi:hypothetical protein